MSPTSPPPKPISFAAPWAPNAPRQVQRLKDRFYIGAIANGISGELADMIFGQIEAFSGYGFPEARSMSFALLVDASAYLKRYRPAAFCAGLLRAQPMGFYSPQSLVCAAAKSRNDIAYT